MGRAVSTAAVTLYPSPSDPQLPVLDKRILLEVRPGASGLVVLYLPLLGRPILPSLLSGDSSLYFTANDVTMGEAANSVSGSMAVDTGSQATLISVAAAIQLGLNLVDPDFEVEVKGIGSEIVTAPGFYIDELSIPVTINQSGVSTNEAWNNVPIIVINAAPFVAPELQITDMRLINPGTVEIDWLSQPAAPMLFLEATTDLTSLPVLWSPVSTGELPVTTGTMIVTGVHDKAYFRLYAP